MTRDGTRALLLVAAVLVTGACGNDAVPTTGPDGSAAEPSGDVLVSAAASLTDAFAGIEAAFEDAHPDVDVVLNLAGSASLREQVLGGAPTDVLASADRANMDRVVDAGGTAGPPVVFATNRLQIAVPAGNPADVSGLDAFEDDELLLGLCAESVPCGNLARTALERAGVTPRIDTNEPDVRALLTKVAAGELDAGITYVTDVTAAGGEVEGVDLPDRAEVTADYPIAVLAEAPNPPAADAFVAFVLDGTGRQVLADHGFGTP